MCRVRWVPSRSGNSVRGIVVDCGGATGNTKISATSTAAVPVSSPPAQTASTVAVSGYLPHRSAWAATVFERGDSSSSTDTSIPGGAVSESCTAVSADSALTQAVTCCCSSSKQRANPGLAPTWTFEAGRCHGIEHSTPISGATNATNCQRDPTTAAARPNATHVAIARVNGEAAQRNSMSLRRIAPMTGLNHGDRAPAGPAAAPAAARRRLNRARCAPTSRAAG